MIASVVWYFSSSAGVRRTCFQTPALWNMQMVGFTICILSLIDWTVRDFSKWHEPPTGFLSSFMLLKQHPFLNFWSYVWHKHKVFYVDFCKNYFHSRRTSFIENVSPYFSFFFLSYVVMLWCWMRRLSGDVCHIDDLWAGMIKGRKEKSL